MKTQRAPRNSHLRWRACRLDGRLTPDIGDWPEEAVRTSGNSRSTQCANHYEVGGQHCDSGSPLADKRTTRSRTKRAKSILAAASVQAKHPEVPAMSHHQIRHSNEPASGTELLFYSRAQVLCRNHGAVVDTAPNRFDMVSESHRWNLKSSHISLRYWGRSQSTSAEAGMTPTIESQEVKTRPQLPNDVRRVDHFSFSLPLRLTNEGGCRA